MSIDTVREKKLTHHDNHDNHQNHEIIVEILHFNSTSKSIKTIKIIKTIKTITTMTSITSMTTITNMMTMLWKLQYSVRDLSMGTEKEVLVYHYTKMYELKRYCLSFVFITLQNFCIIRIYWFPQYESNDEWGNLLLPYS